MKNVSIIVQQLKNGGAERCASNLTFSLKDHYNVHLILFDGSNISYPYEGKLHDLKLPPAQGRVGKLLNIYKRVNAVKQIIKKEKIDCAISLMDGANIVNALAKGRNKVITSVRIQMSKSDDGSTKKAAGLRNKLMRFIGEKSDCVVALSKGVEEDLHDNYGIPLEKLVTIYNPCDGEKLKKLAEKNAVELKTGNALVTMGRMTTQKGHWHLIRALSLVKKQIPDVKLYILGEGGLRSRLEQLTTELELSENVKFLGYMEAPHACFKYCDCFVFPSMFEGLGNVLLEAMAFGLPCIASDCQSGPREILAPGTAMQEKLEDVEYAAYGILTSVCSGGSFNAVDPLSKEEQQLALAIIAMLTDPALREKYAQKSQQRILDFSPEKISTDWVHVIEG